MNNKIKYALLAVGPLLAACTTTNQNENKTRLLNPPEHYEYVKKDSLALNISHAAGLEWYQDSEVSLKQEDHLANGTIYSTTFNSLLLAGDSGLSLSSGNSIGLGLLSAAFNNSKRNFNSELSLLSAWAPMDYASANTAVKVRDIVFNELSAAIDKAAKDLNLSATPIPSYYKKTDRVLLRVYSIQSNRKDACIDENHCILTLVVPTPIVIDTPRFVKNGSEKSYYFYNSVEEDNAYDERLPKLHFSIGQENKNDSDLRVKFIDKFSSEAPDWVYVLNTGLIFNNPHTKGDRHHQPYYANKGEKLQFVK